MDTLNRRNFFASLLGAATLDPERLLWVPGKTVYSIPKPRRGNYIIAWNDPYFKQLAEQFRKNIVFHKAAFALNYPRIGDTVHVRGPASSSKES